MGAGNAITLAPDREPWARQPRETDKQYQAFQDYIAQEPPRSIVKMVQERGHHMYQWSGRNHWVERATHYDGFLRRAHDASLIEARAEMNKRHGQLAKAMSAKVAARIQTLQPEELSPGELGRWMQVISMVERLALGEAPSADTNVQVNVGVQVNEAAPVLDTAYIGEVMDRLAALGIVPEPVTEGEVVEET